MRILVAANCFPWPQTTGTRIRLANVVTALGTLGDVDLITLYSRNPDEGIPSAPPNSPVSQAEALMRPSSRFRGARRLSWLVGGSVPIELYGRDYRSTQARFHEWAAPHYNLVWLSRVESCLAFGHRSEIPTVLDVDALEDRNIQARLDAIMGERNSGGIRDRLHRRGVEVQGKRNQRLWRSFQRRMAATADVAVVCSESDLRYLDVPNGVVIPNGYDPPASPQGRISVGTPPTILFQGLLTYSPNVDAARYLVGRIAPLLRTRIPRVSVHLAGQPNEHVRSLNDPPRVIVTGFVPEMSAELARADLVAVPLRYGGGTRIKILEAFAHRIPVVSTSFGVEGIDVIPGRHLLTADTPESFADACVELLTNPELRASIVEEAQRLFLELYQWSQIRRRIVEVACAVLSRRSAMSQIS